VCRSNGHVPKLVCTECVFTQICRHQNRCRQICASSTLCTHFFILQFYERNSRRTDFFLECLTPHNFICWHSSTPPTTNRVHRCLPSMMMTAILLAQAPVSLMKLLLLLFLRLPTFDLIFLPLLSDRLPP
jgi:hypothetical protein